MKTKPLPPPTPDEGFPEDLERVLARRSGDYRPHRDGAWRWGTPDDLPLGRWGFGPRHAAALETVWDAEADALADELIDATGWAWPWGYRRAAEEHHPRLVAGVRDLAARGLLEDVASPATRIDIAVYDALSLGAYDIVRRRRRWDDPALVATCVVCGRIFGPANGSAWSFATYGTGRYCEPCMGLAEFGVATTSRPRVRRGLRRIAAAIGAPPPSAFRSQIRLVLLPPERRDVLIRALIAAPRTTVPTYPSHLAALQDAQLVGDAWRPGRGTICTATDGHLCLSLGERAIDDWLSRHTIAHDREPAYPAHPELNPDSLRRADWELGDGTLIEYAGMLGSVEYAKRFAEKERLAAILGLRLLVLRPDDLYDLDRALAIVIR